MPAPLVLIKEVGCYRVPLFEKSGLRVLFTTRRFDMAFEARGRRAAYKALGIDGRGIVCSSQAHSDHIFIVLKKHRGRGAASRRTAIQDNDALITGQAGLPVAVLTADCLPVVLWDRLARAAAVVHAGWRGMDKKIVGKTLKKMAKAYGTSPGGVMAVLGPCIRSCCYEVGKEFRGRFPGSVREKEGKFFFDIAAEAERQLRNAGVREGRIYDGRICTCCAKEEFFSYRREGARAGRSMSIAEIL